MEAATKEVHAVIETNLGKIKIKLYNDTPIHRDNFVKAINQGAYDGVIFHRVIKDFMIQGGDPATKVDSVKAHADAERFSYQIDAEIVYPTHFHRKGVLAAARMGDDENPQKASSSTQFYIVTGKVFNDSTLDLMQKQKFEKLKQSIFNRLQADNREKVKELYRLGDRAQLAAFKDSLVAIVEKEARLSQAKILFTPEQRQAYKTDGGTPHLDGAYTVFGEVVEGMDVVDKIQAVSTNSQDKPIADIRMKIVKK
jgi:peptidylprolyl isomerase/peptidyl-prolyl cis-trans isomerase B (cyclophilin B)